MTHDSKKKGVGYKKPPKATQFRSGQSGNPKGRPKGAKNFGTVIEKELNMRVEVTENGRRRKISKREAVAKQLVNKAASGDTKSIPILLNETRAREQSDNVVATSDAYQAAEDKLVMAHIVARIRQMPDDLSETPEPPTDVKE